MFLSDKKIYNIRQFVRKSSDERKQTAHSPIVDEVSGSRRNQTVPLPFFVLCEWKNCAVNVKKKMDNGQIFPRENLDKRGEAGKEEESRQSRDK